MGGDACDGVVLAEAALDSGKQVVDLGGGVEGEFGVDGFQFGTVGVTQALGRCGDRVDGLADEVGAL